MRFSQLFTAGFLLAAALFVATMLVLPPTSRAASEAGDGVSERTPLVLAGP